jgi:hypothetical protein
MEAAFGKMNLRRGKRGKSRNSSMDEDDSDWVFVSVPHAAWLHIILIRLLTYSYAFSIATPRKQH